MERRRASSEPGPHAPPQVFLLMPGTIGDPDRSGQQPLQQDHRSMVHSISRDCPRRPEPRHQPARDRGRTPPRGTRPGLRSLSRLVAPGEVRALVESRAESFVPSGSACSGQRGSPRGDDPPLALLPQVDPETPDHGGVFGTPSTRRSRLSDGEALRAAAPVGTRCDIQLRPRFHYPPGQVSAAPRVETLRGFRRRSPPRPIKALTFF